MVLICDVLDAEVSQRTVFILSDFQKHVNKT